MPGKAARFELPGALIYNFESAITGRNHRLFVSIPDAPSPPNGFPVLYLFDGNLSFATAAEIVRGLSLAGEVQAAVVVGIGYQSKDLAPPMLVRFTDLSLPATPEWIASLPFNVPGLTADSTGGVDNFLRVIESEIKPAIGALAKIDPAHQTLLGHSLGGSAVLRALFTAPRTFRTFAALSPAIWWSERVVLSAEANFSHEVASGAAQPRVFISVGGLEDSPTPASLRFFKSEAEAFKSTASNRMVGNVEDLGARLAAIRGGPAYSVSTVVFPEESHSSVIPAAISRAVRFAIGVDGLSTFHAEQRTG
jgi:predicted alpha/beta superfamily hydrolase